MALRLPVPLPLLRLLVVVLLAGVSVVAAPKLLQQLRSLSGQAAVALRVIVAEDDASVGRSVSDCRAAVCWRRLLPGRHAVNPHATHSRRRAVPGRDVVGPSILIAALRAQRAGDREREERDYNRILGH